MSATVGSCDHVTNNVVLPDLDFVNVNVVKELLHNQHNVTNMTCLIRRRLIFIAAQVSFYHVILFRFL